MQFDFSSEQKELQTSVRRFFTDNSPNSAARGVLESAAGHDESLWKKVGEQGFLAAAIPEAHGGVGAGYLELCVVAQEAGRALAAIPTVSSIYQAAEFLMAVGTPEQQAKWLPRLASGDAIGAIAITEAAGPLTAKSISTRVANQRLTGTKMPVADGAAADFAIVAVRDEHDGISLFIAELAADGVERSPVETVDPSRKHARLDFDGALVEPLGASGEGLALIERIRDRAAVLTAFEQIGGAQAALDMARDYALERFAFGRQIGSFQAIKHMLADMYVSLELARSNAYYGAWALSVDSDRLPAAAASARVAATQAYQLCAANNIQVHGGMGFTWEFDCQLHYRRSNYLALTLGGPSHWEERLIESVRHSPSLKAA